MFRYVKTINNSIYSMEPVNIKPGNIEEYKPGCCVNVENGYGFLPEGSLLPTHITIEGIDRVKFGTIQCFAIKKDMVFKVEFVGSGKPTIGRKVGLSAHRSRYDAVSINSSGCATIYELCEDPNYVYVTFNI